MAKSNNYIEPAEFFDTVLDSRRKGYVTEELGKMFMMLAERFCNHPNWVRYKHLREDMIAQGTFACVKAFDKFSPYNKLGSLIVSGDVNEEDGIYSYTINGIEHRFTFVEFNETVTKTDDDGVEYEAPNEHKEYINDLYKLHKKDKTLKGWQGEHVTYDYKTCFNPFAFYTMVISNALKQLLKTEYKQKNIFNRMCIENDLDPDYGYVEMVNELEAREKANDDASRIEEQEKADNDYEGSINW
jgi:hypothetical protein